MNNRQAFEEWAISTWHSVERIADDPDNFLSGQYKSVVTNTRWDAWQAATAAALERAAQACEEEAADIRSEGKGCHTGQYDHMADGAGRCAQAIRALKNAS